MFISLVYLVAQRQHRIQHLQVLGGCTRSGRVWR